eukprot:21514_1
MMENGIGHETDHVVEIFRTIRADDPTITKPVAAIQSLTKVVDESKSTTVMGLQVELKAAADRLRKEDPSAISLAAGCDLFSVFVTRTSLDFPDIEQCKAKLIHRGETFTAMSLTSRARIFANSAEFIRDGSTVFTHGFSRVVNDLLAHAARAGKQFSVVVCEGRGEDSGSRTCKYLTKLGIPVTLVLDSGVASIMDEVDFVLVGAAGVVESGGIISDLGTYQVAIVAKAFKKPFYVATESYKFSRLYPLKQNDLPETKHQLPLPASVQKDLPLDSPTFKIHNPVGDYTPPAFITLLFTDLGILTPSAVSDELIKLYY